MIAKPAYYTDKETR